MSTNSLPPEVLDRLEAIAAGDALQLKVDNVQRELFREFAGLRQNPGNRNTIVTRLIDVSPVCIFAEVRRDFSAVSFDPDETLSTQWVALTPVDSSRNSSGYNPTPWMFIYDGFRPDRSAPDDPCDTE